MNSRAGRFEWWIWFFGASMVGSQVNRMMEAIVLPEGGLLAEAGRSQVAMWTLGQVAIMFVVLSIQRNVTVRRAHDRDVSAWAFWVYATVIVTYAASVVALSVLDLRAPFHPLWAVAPLMAATGWMIIQFGLRPGDPGVNRWGAPPKPLFAIAPKPNNYRPPRA